MSPVDNRAIVEEIKGKLAIEEVVSAYVPLKKAGRIFKGLCPFHSEKTPSFNVNPERGIYKCFGCGEGGDIFEFVMKMEGLSFPETVRLLGERAGVQVPEWQAQDKTSAGPGKTKLFELNKTVANLWHTILTQHPKADVARTYLQKRGLTPETLERFQIGYAPPGTVTAQTLTSRGFTRAELSAAGDPNKFQDRIVFPIADITGRTVGFTGRLLEIPDDPTHTTNRGPKYWNTPETPLFIKSRTLYALHLAKLAMQEKQLVILAEGQMDVCMLHQFGYTHTVASSGTALTTEQLALLKRFVPAIAFAYDGDKAGREATKRGLELALAAELTPYVIVIPNGKDPAECLQKDPALWERAYSKRLFFMDWILQELLPDGVSGMAAEQRKKVARELLGWLHLLTDPTEKDSWGHKLAAHLQTDRENLRALYNRLFPGNNQPATPAPVVAPVQTKISLQETILALLFLYPETAPPLLDQLKALPAASDVFSTTLQPLLAADSSFESALTTLEDAARTQLNLGAEEVLQPYAEVDLSTAWAITEMSLMLRRLRDESREATKHRIAEAIATAQTLGNTEEVKKLFQELQSLV